MKNIFLFNWFFIIFLSASANAMTNHCAFVNGGTFTQVLNHGDINITTLHKSDDFYAYINDIVPHAGGNVQVNCDDNTAVALRYWFDGISPTSDGGAGYIIPSQNDTHVKYDISLPVRLEQVDNVTMSGGLMNVNPSDVTSPLNVDPRGNGGSALTASIKILATNEPTTITYDDIPHYKIAIVDPNNPNTVLLNVAEYSFKGVVHLTQPSCTTPNASFDLGRQSATSLSSWQSGVLHFTNCQPRYGFGDPTRPISAPVGAQAYGVTANRMLINIHPNTPVINATQGIIDIDETESQSARGIGIQLGYKLFGGPVPMNFSSDIPIYTSTINETTPNIDVPIYYKYVTTSTNIVGGKADATLTYSITYN